jgi:hypothetical protein
MLLAAALMAGCATRFQGKDSLQAVREPSQRLIKQTVLRPDNTPDSVREFSRTFDGKLAQEKILDAAGNVREIVYYDYNNGLRTERRSYNRDNKLTGRRTYSYTAGGLPETEMYYDEKGGLLMVSRFTHDSSGNKTEWTTSDASGNLMARTRYVYRKKQLQAAALSGPSGETNITISITYNAEGRKVRETYTNTAGNTEKEILFFYDETGRLAGQETFSSFKTFSGKSVYVYAGEDEEPEKIFRYDNRGNPRETVIQEYALGGEKSGQTL